METEEITEDPNIDYDEENENEEKYLNETYKESSMDHNEETPKIDPYEQERREEMKTSEEQTYMKLEERKKQSLELLKEEFNKSEELQKKPVCDRRMEFLMAQSDIFTSFLMGSKSKAGKELLQAKEKRKAENRHNKEEEEYNEEEEENECFIRLTKQPNNIKHGIMKPYQIEGLNWLIRLHNCGVNGILADEMGLGKTLQTISLLAYLREAHGTNGFHIIIVPKSTVGNWHKELNRWCPEIRVFRFMGNKEERIGLREEFKKREWDVCIVSYEIAIIEKHVLKHIPWVYMVIDEAHRIKNENSKLSLVVREYKVKHRLLITGTPLQNNLHELWALLNFLLPDVFTSSEDFDSWFNVNGEQGQQNVIKRLHTILRPFLLRRLKVDVEHNLPPKIETKLYVGLTEMQREWYVRVLQKDATHLNAIGGSDRVRLLNILMQLRKVCNHPYLFDGAEPGPPYTDGPHLWENCGKMILLTKLLPRLYAQKSRCLIFCQMTKMMSILEDFLRYFNYDYCRLDGSSGGEERDQMINDFNSENSSKFCFLLSTRAGGLGINLATADIVILYDSDWNPQVDLQAMDRAHRIGQKKTVRVFRFVTEGTVEEKIVEKAERKLYLDAAVIQQGRLADQNRKLSKDELMSMVKFGADEIFNAKGSTVTDEDIDAILAKGEERTAAMKEIIAQNMQHNLRNFSLTGDVGNLYQFDGENFANNDINGGLGIPASMLSGPFIALPQRERKKNYDVNEYYRKHTGLGGRQRKINKDPNAPPTSRLPIIHDFQFLNKEKLLNLYERKNEIEDKRKEIEKKIEDLTEIKLRKEEHTKEVTENGTEEDNSSNKEENGEMDESSATQDEDGEKRVGRKFTRKKNAEELRKVEELYKDFSIEEMTEEIQTTEKELEETEVTDEIEEEIRKLESKGFRHWGRKDLKQFIMSCELYGRQNKEAICQDVASLLGKPEKDVERYYNIFWERYTEIENYQKYLDRIERGEKRIERSQGIREALEYKCSQYNNPWGELTIKYPPGHKYRGGFTPEEDRFLICLLYKYGPEGNWTKIKEEIRNYWEFRFDWFFKSRTAIDLQKRSEFLLKIIEKEYEQIARKDRKDETKVKNKIKQLKRQLHKIKEMEEETEKTLNGTTKKRKTSSNRTSRNSSKK